MLLFLCTILLGAQNCNKNAISSNGIFSLFQPQNLLLPQQLQQQLQLQTPQTAAATGRNVIMNLCEQSTINTNTVHVEAHPNDCEKFYMCFNNYGELFNCPPGHYFDAIELNCVAGICDEQTLKVNALKKNLLNQTNVASASTSASAVLEVQKTRKIKTNENQIFNDDTDICQTNTLMRESTDCHVFHICLQGHFWRMRCPTGRYFDAANAKCVHINNSPSYKCSCVLPSLNLLAHPKNQKQYFVCQDGQAKLRECAPGHYFNKAVSSCLIKQQTAANISNKLLATHLP